MFWSSAIELLYIVPYVSSAHHAVKPPYERLHPHLEHPPRVDVLGVEYPFARLRIVGRQLGRVAWFDKFSHKWYNMFVNEIWQDIPKYEGLYQASNLGRIRRLPGIITINTKQRHYTRRQPGKVLRQYLRRSTGSRTAYCSVALCKQGISRTRLVHHLVLLSFVGPRPKGHNTNHKSGDGTDNRLENLEYVTPKQNTRHGIEVLGSINSNRDGDKSPVAKLKNEQAATIRQLRKENPRLWTHQRLADEFGMSTSAIGTIVKGQSYQEAGGPIETENMQYSERSAATSLTIEIVTKARQLRHQDPKFWSYRKLGRHFGCSYKTLMAAIKGQSWKHVASPPTLL